MQQSNLSPTEKNKYKKSLTEKGRKNQPVSLRLRISDIESINENGF